METLALVVLLAVLLVVLHVVVAAYLYRETLPTDDRPDDEPPFDERATPPADRGPDDAVEAATCPTCGAPNDPSYRFCRRCVADLSGTSAAAGGVATGRLGS